ncbi:MAG: hypothetical protein ACT4P4_17955 [Betaproteobacteria bacterium]
MRAAGRAIQRQVALLLLLLLAGPASAQDCPRIDPGKQKAGERACREAHGRGQGDCEFRCVSKRELPLGTGVTGRICLD